MVSADDMVSGITDLITLPEVALRVTQMADEPRTSAGALARVIAQDAALSARLLRAANSPLFGVSRQIDSIGRAVTVIGARQVCDLALGLSAARAFAGIPNELMSMSAFWDHSIMCAVAARLLAAESGRGRGDALFVAALLHDVGRLVMFQRAPAQSRRAILMCLEEAGDPQLYRCERDALGTDHAQIGGALARAWNLPASLRECLQYHHEPLLASAHPHEVALVHIANSVAELAEIDSVDPDEATAIEPRAWAAARIEPAAIERAVRGVQEQLAEARALFGM